MNTNTLRGLQTLGCAAAGAYGLHVGHAAGNLFAFGFFVLAGLAVLAS